MKVDMSLNKETKPIQYEQFSNKTILIKSGTTTVSRSRPGSNGNKEVLHTLQISRTGAFPSDAVYILLRTCLFENGSFLLSRECSWYVLNPSNRATFLLVGWLIGF